MKLQIGRVVRLKYNIKRWAALCSEPLDNTICTPGNVNHLVMGCTGIIKDYHENTYIVTIKFKQGCIHNVEYYRNSLESDIE
jgi:hypothetical protein